MRERKNVSLLVTFDAVLSDLEVYAPKLVLVIDDLDTPDRANDLLPFAILPPAERVPQRLRRHQRHGIVGEYLDQRVVCVRPRSKCEVRCAQMGVAPVRKRRHAH